MLARLNHGLSILPARFSKRAHQIEMLVFAAKAANRFGFFRLRFLFDLGGTRFIASLIVPL
jgi:hypothetical protein